MRKTPLKRSGKRSLSNREAEAELRLACYQKAGYECQAKVRCWGTLERAHILGRGSHPALTLHPDNDVCLCTGCHRYFTSRPTEFETFVESILPGRLEMLRKAEIEHYGRAA